ncbi:lyase family protein [Falsiruegeria mediterranea]
MLDFGLYRDCFSSADMRSIWSEHATMSAWLTVEQVLAGQQAKLGLIPAGAAEAINVVSVCDLDQAELQREMMLVGRPIVGLVNQLQAKVGAHGKHVHHRSTTQDIMDTAVALQMKLGLEHIQDMLGRIDTALARLIQAHPETRMMGRTNGQHAVPIRLATKLMLWQAELHRRSDALTEAARRGLNVQVGGPVGDLRGYEDGVGLQVKQGVADALGLFTTEPHWQNARDGVADVVAALGLLCATLCKIAHNVNLLSSSDIGEVYEVHEQGKGASSSMAHKRNQRASEFGEAVARLGRQRAEQIGELTQHEHERSGGVWIAEWVVVPEVFLLTSGAVSWTETMFNTLTVNSDAMENKLPGAA